MNPIFDLLNADAPLDAYIRRSSRSFTLLDIRPELFDDVRVLFIFGDDPISKAPGYYMNEVEHWGIISGADKRLIRTLLTQADTVFTHLEALLIRYTDNSSFDIPGLPTLRMLDISHNTRLSGFQLFGNFENLESLDISHTSIAVLPEDIRYLKRLQQLDLRDLNLTSLPGWLPDLGLPFSLEPRKPGICLHNTDVAGVDMQIFSQSQEMIAQWFSAQASQDSEPAREMKVVMLGDDPHVLYMLKAQIAERDVFAPRQDVIDYFETDVLDSTFDFYGQQVKVRFWSFSRPEVHRAMHPVFLTGPVVYMLVLSGDNDLHLRARYWLEEIRALSGNAPVMPIATNTDTAYGADLNMEKLREDYPAIFHACWFARHVLSQEQIDNLITQPLIEQILRMPPLIGHMPAAWQRLKQRLSGTRKSYIGAQEYRHLCRESGIDDEPPLQQNLLHWFCDLGICFCLNDGPDTGKIYLDPSWLAYATHSILFSSAVSSAILSRGEILKLLGDEFSFLSDRAYSYEEVEDILRFMRSYQLSFPFGDDLEFIPLRCAGSMPELLAGHTADDPDDEDILDTHTLRVPAESISDALLYRLFASLRRDLERIWTDGACFRQSLTTQCAHIHKAGDTLYIRVHSCRPEYPAIQYLTVIQDTIQRLIPESVQTVSQPDMQPDLTELVRTAEAQAVPPAEDPGLVEIRVLLLGDGEAGKSQTIQKLLECSEEKKINPDFAGDATPGVDISHGTYTLPGGKKVLIHFWDFGGQEILHSMHRVFLTRQTLCVILLNARSDTQDDRARYWLRFLRSASTEVPALLVLNKIDQNINASINENELRYQFPDITEIIRMSAMKDSVDDIQKNLLTELLRKIGTMDVVKKNGSFPQSWKNIKHELETMSASHISRTDYFNLCRKHGLDPQSGIPRELLEFFNELGVSYYDDGGTLTGDYVILRPSWVTNAIYAILWNLHSKVHNGIVSEKAVRELLENLNADNCINKDETYCGTDVAYIIEVMRRSKLCYPIPESENQEASLFIPMLCERNASPQAIRYTEKPDAIQFWMRFDYLPESLLFMLMVDRYHELNHSTIWFSGALFEEQDPSGNPTGCSAIVKRDETTLKFYIVSSNPDRDPYLYRDVLKANVEMIISKYLRSLRMPENLVVLQHKKQLETFDYTRLQMSLSRKMLHTISKLRKNYVRILDVMNQKQPDEEAAEQALLYELISACKSLQNTAPSLQRMACSEKKSKDTKENSSGKGNDAKGNASAKSITDEDVRNKQLQNNLQGKPILENRLIVMDQSQGGLSTTGIKIGERDLLFCIDPNSPWAIFEALNVVGPGQLNDWMGHFDKLICNYNSYGLRLLFLVAYGNGASRNFPSVWNKYWETIQSYNPGDYQLIPTSCTQDILSEADRSNRLYVARCEYKFSNDPSVPITKVYHIFVHLGK